MVGTPLAILPLILHCKYWKKRVTEEPNQEDLEKGNMEKVNSEMGNLEKEVLEKEKMVKVDLQMDRPLHEWSDPSGPTSSVHKIYISRPNFFDNNVNLTFSKFVL